MNPTVRLSLGLSLFVMTLLLGVEMLGVLPDPQQAILDSRKKTCESLAVYASLAIQKGDYHVIQTTMDVLKERNEDTWFTFYYPCRHIATFYALPLPSAI